MTPFGWLVSARAVFWLDNKNWKPLEWYSEDWPLTSLVSPIVDLPLSCMFNRLSRFIDQSSSLYGSSSSVLQMFLLFCLLLVLTFFLSTFLVLLFRYLSHSCYTLTQKVSKTWANNLSRTSTKMSKWKHLFLGNEKNGSWTNCQLYVSVYQFLSTPSSVLVLTKRSIVG